MPTLPIISIVDDDESVRIAVGSFIRSLGFTVRTFPSAEEFLASPVLDETSCLISDVQMPGMSGLELQKALLARQSRVPVIFITAFPDDGVRRRAEAGGAVGFLSKPFEVEAMIAHLNAALGLRPGS